jgi:cellulose synthase/poly-beta-1,6-N-acetylglucosamine synthase-like glycosyltransferase
LPDSSVLSSIEFTPIDPLEQGSDAFRIPRHLRPKGALRLTVLIAAHNEEQSIGATLDSVLAQDRQADYIVVAADNCTDSTVKVSRERIGPSPGPRVLVYETINNTHKKSGALNQIWAIMRLHTDLFVCIDADTVLPKNALRHWENEFLRDPRVGGCSAKFTMLSSQEMAVLARKSVVPRAAGKYPKQNFRERMWCRVQKAEFAKWTDTALARKGRWTSVLAGTACAIRASALEEVVANRRERGQSPIPWTYDSAVEDFELTYRLRELGYVCRVSAHVRAYTGAMLTLKTLWAQRLKWQVGTVSDLKAFGVNRLTFIDWWQQFLGLAAAVLRVSWVALFISGLLLTGEVHVLRFWWIFPIAFVLCDLREAWRVPHRTKADLVTAALLFPQELFAWLRAGWFVWSWVEVLSGKKRDHWALQIAAESPDGARLIAASVISGGNTQPTARPRSSSAKGTAPKHLRPRYLRDMKVSA